jgi:hypothetical protein
MSKTTTSNGCGGVHHEGQCIREPTTTEMRWIAVHFDDLKNAFEALIYQFKDKPSLIGNMRFKEFCLFFAQSSLHSRWSADR